MAVVEVKNLDGKKVGEVELSDAVFGARVNQNLLHEASRWYLNSLRSGTHKVKERSEVAGSGRKLWRQKGTGRARVGSIRSPLWRKGGTVHGPKPRKYDYALPKKMVLGALRSGLSAKLADEKLTVVDALALESHKTKAFRAALANLDGGSKTTLLVEAGENHNLQLASRNLEGVKLVRTRDLQAYDIIRHDRLVVSKEAALKLSQSLAPKSDMPYVQIAGAPAAAPAKPRKAKKEKE